MKDVGSGLSGIRVGFVISETIHPPTFFFFFCLEPMLCWSVVFRFC